MKKIRILLSVATLMLVATVLLVGCDSPNPTPATGVKDTTQASQDAAVQAANKWGNVNITNFYEYQQLKQIYELRDNPKLILYAYLYDQFTGKLNCMGRIKGFPIPYSTEISQPDGPTYADWTGNTVPSNAIGALINQGSIPEPNGLYPSQATNADWVQWVDPTTGQAYPGYVEADIQVFQAKLVSPIVGIQC